VQQRKEKKKTNLRLKMTPVVTKSADTKSRSREMKKSVVDERTRGMSDDVAWFSLMPSPVSLLRNEPRCRGMRICSDSYIMSLSKLYVVGKGLDGFRTGVKSAIILLSKGKFLFALDDIAFHDYVVSPSPNSIHSDPFFSPGQEPP